MTSTLVIIPAFNEEASLPGVLEELRREAPDCDVLVIDDGSRDRTSEVARAHGVAVAQLPFNLGIGGALRCGFRYAVRHGYDRGIQFDADGQHDAREIRPLLDALDRGAQMAVGSRFADSESGYRVGLTRGLAMRILRSIVCILAGQRFTDTSSGFRAFDRDVLEHFARVYPREYMDSVEALLLARYAGFRVVDVPTVMRHRELGVPSNRNFKLMYHYLRLLLMVVFTMSLRGRRTREGVR